MSLNGKDLKSRAALWPNWVRDHMGVIARGQVSMAPGGAKDELSPVSTEMK